MVRYDPKALPFWESNNPGNMTRLQRARLNSQYRVDLAALNERREWLLVKLDEVRATHDRKATRKGLLEDKLKAVNDERRALMRHLGVKEEAQDAVPRRRKKKQDKPIGGLDEYSICGLGMDGNGNTSTVGRGGYG